MGVFWRFPWGWFVQVVKREDLHRKHLHLRTSVITSRIPKNKETLCFFVFLCFHKQTNQTLEVLSFMKWEQIFFVKEAVTFILRKQDIFVKEVVSFLKKFLVSRKQKKCLPKTNDFHCWSYFYTFLLIFLKLRASFKKVIQWNEHIFLKLKTSFRKLIQWFGTKTVKLRITFRKVKQWFDKFPLN